MTVSVQYHQPPVPAFVFDLDGTLIDSVYQHVIAWRHALSQVDIDLSVWRMLLGIEPQHTMAAWLLLGPAAAAHRSRLGGLSAQFSGVH